MLENTGDTLQFCTDFFLIATGSEMLYSQQTKTLRQIFTLSSTFLKCHLNKGCICLQKWSPQKLMTLTWKDLTLLPPQKFTRSWYWYLWRGLKVSTQGGLLCYALRASFTGVGRFEPTDIWRENKW